MLHRANPTTPGNGGGNGGVSGGNNGAIVVGQNGDDPRTRPGHNGGVSGGDQGLVNNSKQRLKQLVLLGHLNQATIITEILVSTVTTGTNGTGP